MQIRSWLSRAILLLSACALLAPSATTAQDSPSFALTDLIKIVEEGSESIRGRVSAINNDEVIIGYSSHLPSKWSPFVAINDEVERIKTGELGASVTDINDEGVIVGRTVTSRDESLGALGIPTVWIDGAAEELPMPSSAAGLPGYTGLASAINNDGVIVGEVWIDDEAATQFAVVWTDGTPATLPNAFGYDACLATDISENGHISGQCWNPGAGEWQATAWVDGQVAVLDHGAYAFGYAGAIVDDPTTGLPYVVGEVAATQNEPDDTIAVIWDLTLQIGSPPIGPLTEFVPPDGMSFCSSTAVNIVDREIWTVGYCSVPDESDSWPTFAVLWSGDGSGTALDDLTSDAGDYLIQIPYDINANGSIVAVAIKGEIYRGVVLRLEE